MSALTGWDPALTERLRLRRPLPSDLDRLAEIHDDPATHRHTELQPRTRREAEALLSGWSLHWDAHGFGYWVAEPRGEGPVLGIGGVQRLHWREHDVLNLYYRLAPEAWGGGLALELVRAAIERSRAAFPGTAIIARTDSGNSPARRLAERAGLVRRADLDDGSAVFASRDLPARA